MNSTENVCPYCDKNMKEWNQFNKTQHLKVCLIKNPPESAVSKKLTNWFSPTSSRGSRNSSISLNFPNSQLNSPAASRSNSPLTLSNLSVTQKSSVCLSLNFTKTSSSRNTLSSPSTLKDKSGMVVSSKKRKRDGNECDYEIDKLCEGFSIPISNIYENFPFQLLHNNNTFVFENTKIHAIDCCNNKYLLTNESSLSNEVCLNLEFNTELQVNSLQ